MNKSMIWKVTKNILAVLLAFIISVIITIVMVIILYYITPSINDPKVIIKYNNFVDDQIINSTINEAREGLKNPPSYCKNTIKIKDNKNNVRYLSCKEEDSLSYGKNGEIVGCSKVFNDYYFDENNNLVECIGDRIIYYRSERVVYNGSGKVILSIYPEKKGWYPFIVNIYK